MSELIKEGVVVSDKMDKTVVVEVETLIQHPTFHKYVKKRKKFKVHDEKNEAKLGDTVKFVSCKPISKDKHFRLLKITKKYIGLGDEQ
jgi:small subunit ribosomal protein S17